MQSPVLLLVLLGVMALAYHFGYKRAVSVAGGVSQIKTLHSLPGYYGFYAALLALTPSDDEAREYVEACRGARPPGPEGGWRRWYR